ncbi:Hypothetical predicted protein, partial [Paramuricea clavata]
KKSSGKEYTVSENGVDCDRNYPMSFFTAQTIPTDDYPTPVYLFSSSESTWLGSNNIDAYNKLSVNGYFYVSKIARNYSSAIYYTMEYDPFRGWYIPEYTTTPLDGNWTGNVVYVKSHK